MPFDFHEPYLRAVLGFIGITDVDVVRVEGVAMSAIGPQKALAFANARTAEILARAARDFQPHNKSTSTTNPNRKEQT